MGNASSIYWDCRWPDPVAIKVATERLLAELPQDRPDLNLRLPVTVRLETEAITPRLTRALLVTPWAVERIYWSAPALPAPPLEVAAPLDKDELDRPCKGQGAILRADDGNRPVVIAWEPETGHYFVETLLSPLLEFTTPEEAMATATGAAPPPPPRKAMTSHLQTEVSRRGFLRFLR